tara:strand:+ start:1702 stop:2079 length:378 start_codon:yes stop_codon:yes gene_type:complete
MIKDERVLTEKQNVFLEALMLKETKGSIRKAMEIAGYSKTTSINSMVESLGTEIHERANKILQMNAPKAAWGMIEVLDDPSAMGARNSIAAAAQIMDRTGLVKKEQVEVTNTGGAMFILPPKNED